MLSGFIYKTIKARTNKSATGEYSFPRDWQSIFVCNTDYILHAKLMVLGFHALGHLLNILLLN